MKRVFLVVCILASTCALAQITGSAHDFQAAGWNPSGQICIACHTPHNANTAVPNAPLWNHEVTVATYTVYASPSLDASLGQPNGISKLCLSCHDGTVALDSFGGMTGATVLTGSAVVGTSLEDDHPISFVYDANLATTDGELEDPATVASGLGGFIADDLLFNGQMECSSCHDVHGSSFGNLLRMSNSASALCLTCHIK